ncbi:hypothetical protein Hypma_015826 [Hypsizygus marmoreus]|uniref:Uncharacterized protein n=1 Tax=Hypsizygus marmoreus TaxID=39966 RepID=A0A369K2U2_HYPMA|nr:hypothetical protein Hypma_015826 [Hypsizygus marmoreus]
MYNLLVARRKSIAIWVTLQATMATVIYQNYQKPHYLSPAARLAGKSRLS